MDLVVLADCCGRVLRDGSAADEAPGERAQRRGLDFPNGSARRIPPDRWLVRSAPLDLRETARRETAARGFSSELRPTSGGRVAHLGTVGSSRNLRPRCLLQPWQFPLAFHFYRHLLRFALRSHASFS